MIILFTILYITLHICIYFLYIRHVQKFSTEQGIFIYHLGSFAVLFTILSLLYVIIEPLFLVLLGSLSLHGIYSLSFLECWSLSQGGYSISVLKLLYFNNSDDFKIPLEKIGDIKLIDRIKSLSDLRLITEDSSNCKLTPRGKIALKFIQLFIFIGNYKNVG